MTVPATNWDGNHLFHSSPHRMTRPFLRISCVLLGHLAAVALVAQEKPSLVIPPDGLEYLPAKTLGFPIVPKEGDFGKVETLKEDGGPCEQFRRFTVAKMPPNPWKIQLQAGIKGVITKGDTCLLIFYARAVDKKRAVGTANVVVRNPPKFPLLGQLDFAVGKDWEPVVMPFLAFEDGPDGTAAVAIHLARVVQQIDIGGLRLLNYGPEYPIDLMPKAGPVPEKSSTDKTAKPSPEAQ
jgi:hypothetical protein